MSNLEFSGIQLTGIAACVPRRVDKISDHTDLFSEEELRQFTQQVGIAERRLVDETTCTSDLCFHAAEKLLSEMGVDKNDIDMLVLVTQGPDYFIPASSIIIQDRLKLPKKTAAFDVNLGCSGYVYGLSIIYSFLQQQNFKKALLLAGDTPSKSSINPRDKSTCLLFGDAGTATIIEKTGHPGKSFFNLFSDGAGHESIIIYGGQSRMKPSVELFDEKICEGGNVRCAINLVMSGPDIFNFTIREVPKSIIDLLAFAGRTLDETDFIIYHQANKFINSFLTQKLKFPAEKTPYSLEKFGNTSSASIPMTIVTGLREKLRESGKRVVLSGFGVGLSWGNALMEISDLHVSELLEI